MNRPSYKELWLYERKDRDEQLQWIRNAVNGNAKFRNSEPPYSYEEELAREIMQLHTRIAELEAENDRLQFWLVSAGEEIDQLTAHSDIERQDDKWIPVSERLPEANKCVLVYDAGGNMTVDFLVTSGEVEKYFWLAKYRILFWMPLPEPPKERE